MFLVDSSVWVDHFRGDTSVEADLLDQLLGQADILIADLVLTEVLQGFDSESDYQSALSILNAFPVVAIGGRDIAIAAARNFRTLRHKGITIRKTIDTVIATWCIQNDAMLLARDRDFAPFAAHLGLRLADCSPATRG